ncbi:Fur family transcriptional regulator [Aquimarina agarilytica]|uniref:Fur family transcriptional regulator n=1 Tax=Aquimarina agarilytica TaxID=1087449 RepID=UPI000287B841|nr:transcriptional repressor [Aquimarina agarilytica]
MDTHLDFAKKLLSNRNLKATATRIELLQVIKSFGSAIPYSKIQEQLTDTDRITLYRTIQTLLNKCIIHKALTNKEETYYALCGSSCTADIHAHDHVHFKCNVCNNVTCQHLNEEITIALPNFTIEKMQVLLTGICNNCN